MRTAPILGLANVLVILAASGAAQPAPEPTPPADCVRTTIGPVVVNVPSVRIRPRFLLNGQPFPGLQAGTAVITLWASEPSPLFDGPQLSLGQTHQPPKAVRVVPGVYDVYYSRQSGSRVPRNELTRVMQRVSIQHDGELVVDVPMVRIAGFKRHNGKPFADDRSSGRLSLQRADGRGSVPLGSIRPSPFVVHVIAGLYSFRYEWQAGATIPRNQRATVGAALALEKDRQSLVLDVPSVRAGLRLPPQRRALPAIGVRPRADRCWPLRAATRSRSARPISLRRRSGSSRAPTRPVTGGWREPPSRATSTASSSRGSR